MSAWAASASAVRRPIRLPKLCVSLLLLLFVGVVSVAAATAPATPAPMTVLRVVAGRVDIDVPGTRRPAVGSRLVVQRDGQSIAELEVTILSDHQASCRIVRMTAPIAGGDLVVAPTDKAPASPASPASPANRTVTAPQAEAAGEHPSNQAMIVQRVLRGAVDISLVTSQPVAVGDRLVVERGSLVIGELEVVLMGEHSATCRIDREVRPITQGDRVRRLDVPPPAAAAPAPAVVAAPVAPAAEPEPTIPATPAAPTVPGEPAVPQPIRVRQVLAEEIFLDAGRSAGLAAGQRVKILRADATTGTSSEIAELEIAFIASHSASCKIVSATETIAVGDLVIPGPVPASAAIVTVPGAAGAGGAPTVPSTGGKPPGWNAAEHTDYSGSLALRFQGFKDGSPAGRDFNQESALVNIYACLLYTSPSPRD